MIKWIFKTIFFGAILLFIAAVTFVMVGGLGEMLDENITSIFVIPLIYLLFVWIFSFIIDKIATSLSFVYWFLCFGFCILVLVLGVTDNYGIISIGQISNDPEKAGANFFMSNQVIAWQATLLMFLIPQLEGEWNTYLNTEVTYYSDGDTKKRSWISKEYTSGAFKKLAAITVITFVATILYRINHLFAWLVFLVEGGECFSLLVANVKYFFFTK